MERLVVDASVGAKWYFREEFQEAAFDLLERAEKKEVKLVVPELFYLEIGNLCWKLFRRRTIQFEDAAAVLNKVSALPVERYSDQKLAGIALENAARFGISVYDGVYLALAEIYAAPLVTADEGILMATKNRFDFVLSLKEFKNGISS